MNWVLVGEEVDDFKCMGNYPDGHQFLSVVATVHHQTEDSSEYQIGGTMQYYLPVNQTFYNGHLCLLELLFGISSCGMRQEYSMSDLNVICQGDILDFNTRRHIR